MIYAQEYFDYWSHPQNGNDPLIKEYISALYCVPSLELNIPADWGALWLPGQLQQGGMNTPNALPNPLKHAITKLGFIASMAYSGRRLVGSRRYILRPHHFPISIVIYQTRILPNLRSWVDGANIHDNESFNRTLDGVHNLHRQDLAIAAANNPHEWIDCINQYYDHYGYYDEAQFDLWALTQP